MTPVRPQQMLSVVGEPAQRRMGWWQGFATALRSGCGHPSAEPKLWPVLLVAVFVALVILTVPTAAPDLGADPSWGAVLQWAHQHGLQFGKDIVFTYGPLGFLLAPYALSQPTTLVLLANTVMCFVSALGLCLAAWRLGAVWRWLLLGVFIVEAATIEFRADLVVEVGLLSWGLLCLVESGNRQRFCAASFVLFAGFVSLTKMTHLLSAGLSVCAVASYALLDGKSRLGTIVPVGFAGVFLLGWLSCGQALSNLGGFLLNGFLISRDYDQAVGLDGLPMLRLGGALLGIFALASIVSRVLSSLAPSGRRTRWRRAVLLAWACALLFMVWKHSMVRVDRYHIVELAVFAPVVALALEALGREGTPESRSKANSREGYSWNSLFRGAARALAVACCLVSWGMMEYAFLPDLWVTLSQPFRQFAYHAGWLISPADCRQQLQPSLEAWRREADLPRLRALIGGASVDVFGLHQAHALLNGLNYQPRPIFQSYAAYSARLARLNEEFYLSTRAPEYVLMEFRAPERRFPTLEDGLALRALLINYEPVAAEGLFLLLKRHSAKPAKLTLLREGIVALGKEIDLSEYPEQELWLEIEVEPTLLGRLVKVLTRPAPIRLSAWRQTESGPRRITRGRAVPSLLRTGFVASPCLFDAQDIRDMYTGERLVKPSGYCVEPDRGSERLWKSTVQYRVYEIESRLGSRTAK